MLRNIYIGMLLLLPLTGWGQQGAWYRTQLLSQLSESAQLSLTPQGSDTTLVVGHYKGYPVVAEWKSGWVEHLGLRLFAPEVKAATNKTLCDFAERYLFEELTFTSREELERKHYDDSVVRTGDLPSIVGQEGLLFSINSPETGRYELTWDSQTGARLFSIALPANWELISGRNKIELEDGLRAEINNYPINQSESPKVKSSRLEKTSSKGIYLQKRGYYLIPQMASALYYREIEGEKEGEPQYELLVDRKYAAESLSNLLSVASLGKGYIVNLKQMKYGFKQESYSVSLEQMIGFFLAEGCRPYVGIEQCDERTVVATLIMVNSEWGYNHILQVTVERNQIGLKGGQMSASINSYTPTHNLESLYDDESQEQNKTSVKIELKKLKTK